LTRLSLSDNDDSIVSCIGASQLRRTYAVISILESLLFAFDREMPERRPVPRAAKPAF